MSKGKHRKHTGKEQDLLQRLQHENDKLKRQNKRLRKQFQRVDLDRYENIKDIINKHYEEDNEQSFLEEQKKLKKQWECHKCGEGFLKLYTISRRDGMVYYRKCSECSNRTPVKPYNKNIEGVRDDND